MRDYYRKRNREIGEENIQFMERILNVAPTLRRASLLASKSSFTSPLNTRSKIFALTHRAQGKLSKPLPNLEKPMLIKPMPKKMLRLFAKERDQEKKASRQKFNEESNQYLKYVSKQ